MENQNKTQELKGLSKHKRDMKISVMIMRHEIRKVTDPTVFISSPNRKMKQVDEKALFTLKYIFFTWKKINLERIHKNLKHCRYESVLRKIRETA